MARRRRGCQLGRLLQLPAASFPLPEPPDGFSHALSRTVSAHGRSGLELRSPRAVILPCCGSGDGQRAAEAGSRSRRPNLKYRVPAPSCEAEHDERVMTAVAVGRWRAWAGLTDAGAGDGADAEVAAGGARGEAVRRRRRAAGRPDPRVLWRRRRAGAGRRGEDRRPAGGLRDRGPGGRRGRAAARVVGRGALHDAADPRRHARMSTPASRSSPTARPSPGTTRSARGTWAAASSRSTRRIPTACEQPDVPKGKLTQMPPWKSKIFDGTTRDWWVYVPAQYTDEQPACVMVFQDGAGPKDFVPDGLRQPDRQEGHAGHGRHLHQARAVRATAARTAASSTTRSPTSTRGSCSRRSCPRSRRR